MSTSTFALNEILRGIRHAFQTWTIPIWVAFGMQLLLDIQDIFGASIQKPFQEVQAHVKYASNMLVKNLDFRRPFPVKGNEQAHLGRATTILREIRDWAFNDMFAKMLRQQPGMTSHSVVGPIANQQNYLLEHHPLRCGMLKYDLYLQLHTTGTGVEGQAMTISLPGTPICFRKNDTPRRSRLA